MAERLCHAGGTTGGIHPVDPVLSGILAPLIALVTTPKHGYSYSSTLTALNVKMRVDRDFMERQLDD